MADQDQEYKEYQEYLAYLDHVGGGKSAPVDTGPTWSDRAKQAAYYATRPLDYLGGIARTGVGATAQDLANLGGKLKAFATGEEYQPIEAVSDEDMRNAFKGNAPSSAEMLKRAGVSEGGSLSDVAPALYSKDPNSWRPTPHGTFDPTARGAVGMGLDIATDPLTYLGAGPLKALLPGGRAGAVADHILNPAENALQAGGKTLYKSAPIMKAADAVNERFSKGAASDILFDQGIKGTGRQIANKAEVLAEATGKERDALLKRADEAGGTLDMEAAMSPADAFVAKVRASKDPQLQGVADALEERAQQYKKLASKSDMEMYQQLGMDRAPQLPAADLAHVTPSAPQLAPGTDFLSKMEVMANRPENGAVFNDQMKAQLQGLAQEGKTLPMASTPLSYAPPRGVMPSQGSGFKSSLYNDTGNATWDTLRRTPQGDLGNRALARGLDQETSAAAERVIPGAGGQIDNLNDTWGALLTPKKALENEALKGERKNFITSVDGLTAGITHGNPTVLAAKKATDLMKTNWLRTNVGRGAYQVGNKVPMLDELLRREILNNQSSPDDWKKLMKGN